MSIIIEDGLSLKIHRGVGQYTLTIENLVSAVGLKYIIPHKTFLENIKNKIIRRCLYIVWLNTLFLLKLLFSKDIEAVIFTSTLVPFIKVKRIKYITVIHDFLCKLYPNLVNKNQKLHSNIAINSAIKHSDIIIVVSDTVKKECINLYDINDSKIKIVYNCHTGKIINSEYNNLSILSKYNLKYKKYILLVATIDNHKNGQMLIDSFNQIYKKYPDIKLVVVGANGNSKVNNINPNVILTGFVSDDDLSILYKNALIYAFPSIYEGFGIPIIDAQMLGVPVICSDIPVFREVAGNGALFCNLTVESFANGLEKLLASEKLRDSLVTIGKENTKRFTVENIKKQLKDVIS